MRRSCLLIYFIIFKASLTLAATPQGPVNLTADSLVLDQETGLYLAEGDVRIEQGEIALSAAEARWDQQAARAVCSGGIRLESPAGILTGESLTYDFATGTGLLRDGTAELASESVFLSGDKIEKRGPVSYRVTGGSFTTCPGDTPAWKLTASRLDVDVEGYARARNAVFYLRDIPVLYLPFIALPAKTERQSGLLLPELSRSDRLGVRYIQPYYHVIDDHMDATLTLDYMSDFGVGTALEYRYLFRRSKPGRFYGNYITGIDGEPDRALVEWQHDGRLPGDVRLAVDAEYVNKKDYFNIFGGDADVYASEKSESTLYLSRGWDKTILAGQASYIRNLDASSAEVLQYLPEIRFDYLPQRLGVTPVFASLLGESAYLWQRRGMKGTRTRLRPLLSTDLLVGRYLEVVPRIAWLHRDYRFEDNEQDEGLPITDVTVGSRFGRVYRLDQDGMTHLRHAVEPIIRYRYIPEIDQDDLPQLDSRDRVAPENLLTLELMNRFTARFRNRDGNVQFRELASLRVGIDYDIREERRTTGPPPDEKEPFSPIRGELILRPSATSFLRGDLEYDFESDDPGVERWAAWGGYHGPEGNGLLFNYNFRRDDFDYLDGGVDLAVLAPWFASYRQRYDLESDSKIEDVAQLEYRGKCWSIMLSYRDRPDEQQVSLEFSLSGLSGGRLIEPFSASIKKYF